MMMMSVQLKAGGRIRLGEKRVKEGREYPVALEYFNLVDVPEVVKGYGKKPTSLVIEFPVNNVEKIWDVWYKFFFGDNFVACRGDGETAKRYNSKTKRFEDVECPGRDECSFFKQSRCQQVGRLRFCLPDVDNNLVYEVQTSSFNSIKNLTSALNVVLEKTDGNIAGIHLILSLVKKEIVYKEKDGKFHDKTIHILTLNIENDVDRFDEEEHHVFNEDYEMPDEEVFPDDLYPRSVQTWRRVEPESLDKIIDRMKKLGKTREEAKVLFKDYKHNRGKLLERLEAELLAGLGEKPKSKIFN
jgi:hypothetical protein